MSEVQLGGTFKLGPVGGPLVDYSNYVSQMTLSETREIVQVPATLGLPRTSQRLGPETATLTIQYHSDFAATSLWAELRDAIKADDGELDFEFQLEPGAPSVSNPKHSGTIRVTELVTGVTVGSLRQQSTTFPVTEAGVTTVTA